MNLQEFDYLNEKAQLDVLHNQNFGSWLKSKNELLKKTKFSLNEITEYLEHGICSLKQENWIIRRIAFYDENKKTVDLVYYALDEEFDCLLRSLVKRNSKSEQEIQSAIEFLTKNDLAFLIGSKSFHFEERKKIFSQIERFENEPQNYLEEGFFQFPISLDDLYQVIINHINQKNNKSYQKSH